MVICRLPMLSCLLKYGFKTSNKAGAVSWMMQANSCRYPLLPFGIMLRIGSINDYEHHKKKSEHKLLSEFRVSPVTNLNQKKTQAVYMKKIASTSSTRIKRTHTRRVCQLSKMHKWNDLLGCQKESSHLWEGFI